MTPTEFGQTASSIAIRYTTQPCWLGWVLMAGTAQGICAIALDDTVDEREQSVLRQPFDGVVE